MSDYDVIVIGSGAGGGTLVRHLAPPAITCSSGWDARREDQEPARAA